MSCSSEIESLIICKHNSTSMQISPIDPRNDYSFLLSPLRSTDLLKPTPKLFRGRPNASIEQDKRREEIKLKLSPRLKNKHHVALKSFTIDLTRPQTGIDKSRDVLENRSVIKKRVLSYNSSDKPSLRNRKTKSSRYSINPSMGKFQLNDSFEIRVSRLTSRVPTSQHQTINPSKMIPRQGSLHLNRERQKHRLLSYTTSRLRDRYYDGGNTNMRSSALNDIKPWELEDVLEHDPFL